MINKFLHTNDNVFSFFLNIDLKKDLLIHKLKRGNQGAYGPRSVHMFEKSRERGGAKQLEKLKKTMLFGCGILWNTRYFKQY